MPRSIAIITDDTERSSDVADAARASHDAHMIDIDSMEGGLLALYRAAIIDVPLGDAHAVARLRQRLVGCRPSLPKIFVADTTRRHDRVQANGLGAQEVVDRARLLRRFDLIVARHAPRTDTRRTVDRLEDTYHGMFAAVQNSEPLPRHQVDQCAKLVAHTLIDEGVTAWLEELKRHHSYTHRHSMHVTGFAVAFGLHYGMRDSDVHRLAVGALMHDIGKAQIPLEILDKSMALSDAERRQIHKHAVLSAEVLVRDGQFDAEVVDVARHHHEYLDGTGYPDGLAGGEISDLVRIVAIADVFSALVDQRAYKRAIPREKAYSVMCRMQNKLDMTLVRAFEPIALGSNGSTSP